MYAQQIKRMEFTGETSKDAYLKACKWVANNLESKEGFKKLVYKIQKVKKNSSDNVFELCVFLLIDEKEIRERHCKICKEFHVTFFKNDFLSCNECKLNAFYERRGEVVGRMKSLVREKLK